MTGQKVFSRLTDSMRRESLRATLAAAPNEQIWVFAYGSLMWNPAFAHTERRVGTLSGYRRRFCVLSSRARGTAEKPGLGLGLDRCDGDCRGVVYRLGGRSLGADLRALWEREMSSGIYRPQWLPVRTGEGTVEAIAFVVDRDHPLYSVDLSPAQMAQLIRAAAGHYGPCRDYLARTVQALAALDIREPEFDDLLARVNAQA
jgi:cation transport protein ChaC